MTAPFPLPPSFLITKYESVDFIGSGAYGRVFRCLSHGRNTAVKVLNPASEEVTHIRFLQEIEILKKLDHQHVVKLLNAGEDDGNHWYESEYANEGHFGKMFGYLFYNDLHRVKYFSQICLGLSVIHDLGIIHRDLKPSNVLVFQSESDQEVTLKIADFGLSLIAGVSPRLTATGDVVGTADYLAPEVKQNPRRATVKTDIYSLGITFLEACTGHTSISENNLKSVSPVLAPIIRRMVSFSPDERHQSVAEVLEDLNKPSLSMLILGRELEPNEPGFPSFSSNIAGVLQRQVEVLHSSTPETIEDSTTRLEQSMDRLGSHVYDNKAQTISSIPIHALKILDEVKPVRLLNLMQTFAVAADKTRVTDFFFNGSDTWAWFLVQVYGFASYAQTKDLCLESLVRIMTRFDTEVIRYRVYHLIKSMDDPTDIQHLSEFLRYQKREDIADLLNGVPHERELDDEALRNILAKSQTSHTSQ